MIHDITLLCVSFNYEAVKTWSATGGQGVTSLREGGGGCVGGEGGREGKEQGDIDTIGSDTALGLFQLPTRPARGLLEWWFVQGLHSASKVV